MESLPIIDPIINVANAWTAKVEFTRRAEAELFDASPDFSRDIPAEEMIELLDRVGVERAIVGVNPEDPPEWVLDYTKKFPGRFFLAAEPRLNHGLDALWAMEDLCAAHPVVTVRAAPMFVKKPATDPVWYPLYVKCIELDLPLGLTTGIPGPPLLPADVQNPLHLDPVLLEFPALKLVMLHGADPWWGVAMRLLLRHRNLHMVTSAWAPRYLPKELIEFMNTRGADKVLFGSDHPVLNLERAVREAKDLDLRPGVLERYLFGNADRVFFGERRARHITHAPLGL